MKHHLIEVKYDLFNIARRLKSINRNFIVCFNRLNHNYELYSKKNNNLVFEKNLGSTLTSLAIKFAHKNRVEHLSKILDEIDTHNQKIDKENREKSDDLAKQSLKELIHFADKQSCDVDFSNEKIYRR